MKFSPEFSILVSNLFEEKELKQHVKPGIKTYPKKVEEAVNQSWDRADKTYLFNGTAYALSRYEKRDKILHYWVQQTDYKHFWGTNLQANMYSNSFHFASILAVCAVIETADHQILVGKRSEKVAESQSCWHVIGGNIDAICERKETAFQAMRKEIKEEINLEQRDICSLICLGLGRNERIRKPEFLFYAKTFLTQADLSKRLSSSEDSYEHQTYRFIPRDELLSFVETHPFAIIGKAAIHQYYHFQEKI